ncbi:hypothetical protein N7490_006490 [Penicillium lividum]|nr:hypothetical protein N7490_006490 [Penicillium lividum]
MVADHLEEEGHHMISLVIRKAVFGKYAKRRNPSLTDEEDGLIFHSVSYPYVKSGKHREAFLSRWAFSPDI